MYASRSLFQQREHEKLGYEKQARAIVREALPGQIWAEEDMTTILARALMYARPRAEGEAQGSLPLPALVHSFFLVGPSGCGKTHFGRVLSARLNAGADFLFHVSAQDVAVNPGRTIAERLANKMGEWISTHERRGAGVAAPIVAVLMDETDHASPKLFECCRSMIDGASIELPSRKPGALSRRIDFPSGWVFLFIWSPNDAGDKYLTCQPPFGPAATTGAATAAVAANDNVFAGHWDLVSNAVTAQVSKLANSILRRLMTRLGERESIVLLYRLSGELKQLRCDSCLAYECAFYKATESLTLKFAANIRTALCSWSEAKVPIFDQVHRQLVDAVGTHSGGPLLIELRQGKLQPVDDDATAHTRDELDDILARMQRLYPTEEDEMEPGGLGAIDSEWATYAADAAAAAANETSASAASAALVPMGGVQSTSAAAAASPSSPSSSSASVVSACATQVVELDLSVWEKFSTQHDNAWWFPMSSTRIGEMYSANGHFLPPDVLKKMCDSVRKVMRKSTNRWSGPAGSNGSSRPNWYRTADLWKVWSTHVRKTTALVPRPVRSANPVTDGTAADHPASPPSDGLSSIREARKKFLPLAATSESDASETDGEGSDAADQPTEEGDGAAEHASQAGDSVEQSNKVAASAPAPAAAAAAASSKRATKKARLSRASNTELEAEAEAQPSPSTDEDTEMLTDEHLAAFDKFRRWSKDLDNKITHPDSGGWYVGCVRSTAERCGRADSIESITESKLWERYEVYLKSMEDIDAKWRLVTRSMIHDMVLTGEVMQVFDEAHEYVGSREKKRAGWKQRYKERVQAEFRKLCPVLLTKGILVQCVAKHPGEQAIPALAATADPEWPRLLADSSDDDGDDETDAVIELD